MQTAYLALGANLGDRLENLRGGRAALDASEGVRLDASSALYETEPVGGPDAQGPYLNAVLRVKTTLPPRALLALCLEVEARFGRRREQRWGARTLDIDLLLYAERIVRERDLVVPHPRMHERPFVLIPLLDLQPAPRHPLLDAAPDELLRALPNAAGVRRTSLSW